MTETPSSLPAGFTLYYADSKLQASWDASSCPAGYSVVLELLDSAGQPLSPQPTVEYQPGHATITLESVTPGAQFWVRARVVSPYTPTASVTIHDVGPVGVVAVDWRQGNLHATWTAPTGAGPFTYGVTLLNQDGTPVTPAPAITPEGSTGAAIAGETLVNGDTYIVAIQAEQEGSFGPTTNSPPYKLDKNLPDSPLLRALLGRLNTAIKTGQGAFALSPDVVQDSGITDLFGALLEQEDNSLALTGAALTYNSTSVTLTATATYPFASGKASSFCFTDVSDKLQLALTISSLGSYTVQQLIDSEIIPDSTYDSAVWAADLAPLPELDMLLDSQTASLSFTGTATTAAWGIPIGLVNVSTGTVAPAMQIIYTGDGEPLDYRPCVSTTLTLGTNTQIPILITMPCGMDGWRFSLNAEAGVSVGDLANFNPLMGGANSSLPDDVISLGDFKLTQLSFGFAAEPTPGVWNLVAGFGIGPAEGSQWSVLNGLINLKGISALVNITLYTAGGSVKTSTVGSIGATLVIKDQLTVSVGLSVPASNGAWLLSGSAVLDSFSFADLAAYLGGSEAPLTGVLNNLGTVGSVGLTRISLLFTPTGSNAGLHALSADFSLASWTVPALSWFAIDQLFLSIDVQNPTSNDRGITGQVGGKLTLGNVQVGVIVDFSQADTWILRLVAQAALLSGLDQIANVLPTNAITAILPSGLNTSTTYGLGDFSMTYNTAQSYISACTFLLDANTGWRWLNDLLTLWSIKLDLDASRASKDDSFDVTGSIGGTVGIGGVIFDLSADKPAATQPWSFSGELAEAYYLDFNTALQALRIPLQIPSGYGLPTAISFDEASLTVVPSTGKLDFKGLAGLAWSLNFGLATLAITSIGGELHMPGGDGKSTGAVNGLFTIGAITGYARIALGDSTTTDTVIDVSIATGEQPDGGSLVDGVIGANTYSSVSVPSAFTRPTAFARADLSVNLTKSSLLLSGQYAGSGSSPLYAGAALLVANKAPADQPANWGFILVAALDNWTLADISSALAGLDALLGLNRASAAVALSLLDDTAGATIAAQVPAIPSGMPIKPGLNFYIALDFSNSTLLQNVRAIIDVQGPYTLSGNIPADTTKAISLAATLGSLKLLSTIAFNDIILTYVKTPAAPMTEAAPTPTTGNHLTLTGDIVVSLDKPYTFHGDLDVTDTAANFKVATTNSVPNPLGIPGITLDRLGFAFSCTYGNGSATDTLTTFYGQVTFTSGPTLLGLVGLKNGNASLVLVQLVSPDGQPRQLSVSNLLSQATGLTWPDALDVSLSNGHLRWVPGTTPVMYQGQSYAAGFHGSAQVKIFFLPAAMLDVAVYSTDTETEKKGLVATAQLVQPVDWGFIKFAGTQNHGGSTMGPWVSIDTRQTALPFGLGSGLNMLGVGIGDIQIRVGKEKMSGTFTLPENAGVFAGSSIQFTWDENGFTVENWPLQGLNLPKFDLDDIKGSGACSQVIMDSLPIDTKFDIDASLSIDPPSGDTPAMLAINLNGSFNLVVSASAYKSDPLLTVPIVNVPIRVPFPTSGGYDWSLLRDEFVNALKAAGESMINNLLTGPDAGKNWAKLVAVVGAKWALGEMVDYLVCRGMPEAAAEAAVGAATGAIAGEASVLGGAAVAVGGVIVTIIGGVIIVSAIPPDPKKPKPGQPGQPTLTFDTDHLSLAWAGSSNANQYGIALVGDDGVTIPVSAVTGTATTVPASQLRLGQKYTARIVASGDGGQGDPSPAGSLFLVTAPTAITLAFSDPTLTVTWQAVTGNATYQVQVLDHEGKPLSPPPAIHIDGTTAAITAQAFEQGGSFQMQVRATAPGDAGPWGTVPLPIHVLPAPEAITAMTVGSALSVAWQAVAGATGYAARVLDQNGQPLTPQPDIRIDGTTATISGAGIVDGAQLKVAVKGTALGAVGTFAAPVPVTVTILPAPSALQLLYHVRTRKLNATWQAVPRASAYTAEVLDQAGQLLSPQPPVVYDGAGAEIDLAGLPDATYGVKVQAKAPGTESAWSPTSNVTLVELAAPANLALTFAADAIAATWSQVPNATGYEAQVLDSAGHVLDPQPPITYAGTSASIAATDLTPDATYQVQVMANAPSVVGPYSNPVSVAIPPRTKTALSLPSASSNVLIPSLAAYSFAGTGDFTLEARVRGTVGGTVLFRHGSASQHQAGFDLSISPQGTVSLTTVDATGNTVTYPNIGNTAATDGNWHQVAAVRQTQNGDCVYTLYLDGQKLRAFPPGGAPLDITVDAALYVGSSGAGGASGSWIGNVRQAALWNVALSAGEIAAHVTSPPDPNDERMVGYWPLTDNSANDSSRNHNNGTAEGGAIFVNLPINQ
jgi:hypothetical protein